MLICPVCSQPLLIEEKRACCAAGHSFDRAKEGYFNLLLSSSAGGHGDDRAMLAARRAFLEKGYYSHLLSALTEICLEHFAEGSVLVDAGCGEGYYTSAIYSALLEKKGRVDLYAFDIAKDAARMVSKKMGKAATVFVSSAYRMPLKSACADGILSLFAPFAREEYLRVLKPGGLLIRAYPMEEHLYSLKKAVYENPLKNEATSDPGEGWDSVEEIRVEKHIELTSNEDITALFGMTPYAHKTSEQDRNKLQSLSKLSVETDFGVAVYRKKN
ncbi:MAG: methyltransferase domain-containing protein [Clostridia bacterium]|nr:methyltransferase domain-containing protein [Clostridia bacterium]